MTTTIRDGWEQFIQSLSSIDGEANKRNNTSRNGRLTIVGSGLGLSDTAEIMADDISTAEVVLFCVADPITKLYIQRAREDAVDLGILYSPLHSRYETYVQMAEAMLKPARDGKKVLSIYYGHPGVFAMPTHRAIAIARQEGIDSVMRPGISALDYIIADVGFDPAYPGLLSYEATDLLLRGRRLDPSLHTILWQVGVVGEMGQAVGTLKYPAFDMLLDYIFEAYGNTEIVHYIGSRFRGFQPLIDRSDILTWKSGQNPQSVTALSTFYIPPVERGTNQKKAAEAMQLENLDFSPNALPVQFDRTRYGVHEHKALARLAKFRVPNSYRDIAMIPIFQLLYDLERSDSLRDHFHADPDAVLSLSKYKGISPKARGLLRTGRAIDVQRAIVLS